MTTLENRPDTPRLARPGWLPLTAMVASAIAVGLLASQQPLLAAAALLVVGGALAMMAWPDLPTLVVLFALYTNAAVIAVKYHGVPFAVGAALPLLLVIPLGDYLLFRRRPVVITPALPWIFLLMCVQLVGALLSKDVGLAFDGLIEFLVEGLGLYFLLTNVIRTPTMLRRAVWALLIAGILIGGLSFIQQVTGSFDKDYGGFAQASTATFGTGVSNLYGEVEQPRLQGPVGEKNRFAQVMLMLVPLGLYRLWIERSLLPRLLAGTATFLSVFGMALTFSRGAAVAFAGMLVVMGLLGQIKARHIVLIVVLVVMLFAALPQYALRLTSLQGLAGLVSSDARSSEGVPDGSIVGRATEMTTAWYAFLDHPLVGVGPRMFGPSFQEYAEMAGQRRQFGERQAHNLFLGAAAETGTLGIVCLFMAVGLTMWQLLHLYQRHRDTEPDIANIAMALFLALFTYLATGMGLHFAYIRYFWLVMALGGATIMIARSLPSEVPHAADDSAPTLSPSDLGAPATPR